MMKIHKNVYQIVLAILLFTSLAVSHAALPEGINYQAYLTDDSGAPIDSDVSITFAAYNVEVGGVPLWSSTQTISPDNGLFSVTLGNPVNPLPPGLFDTPVFIGLFVAGEEMLPRRALKAAAYAYKAADAETLEGMTAGDLDQSTDVADLQSNQASIEATANGNSASISTLQSDVSANAGAISTVEGELVVVDGRLDTLESNPGDITGVAAGPGLAGGADSGQATLEIAPGGVTGTMIADENITTADIADGSITGSDLSTVSTYTLGDTTVGDLTVTRETVFDSVFDITIRDDFNGLRWRSTDGTQLFSSITVRESEIAFRDDVRGRTLLESNDIGIGIGTTSPTAGYDVTIPSLNVTGNIGIGYERVSVSYELSISTANCHSHGNLPCFNNAATVQCPVGKKILGGGAQGSSARFGSVGTAYPASDSSFSCAASYDLANATRSCVALCARVD